MKEFVKRNFVLVLGIALPVLLILIFAFAKALTQLVDPPHFRPVFAVQDSTGSNPPFAFQIDESGKLAIKFHLTPYSDYDLKRKYDAHIFVFDPERDSTEEFKISSPDPIEGDKTVPIEVPKALADLKFFPEKVAPDGYVVEPSRNSGGNIFTELFGYRNSYYTRYVLKKNGRNFPITAENSVYGTYTHIGWVKPEGATGE